MTLHGEQGGEGIRKEFNKLDRVMAGIRDPRKKLLAKRTHCSNRPRYTQGNYSNQKEKTVELTICSNPHNSAGFSTGPTGAHDL